MSTEASPPGRAAFVFIFITVALDMLALGIIVPVLPRLIVSFEGGDVARASAITGVFGTVWAAMQFVFSPILGSLSDRYGRRPVILLSNLGLGLDYVLMAMAGSLPMLFLGRVISGITSSSFPTASAYIADVTPEEKRAAQFGMLSAAFGLGFVVGPAVGGWLGEHSLRLPFWVASGLSLANALYGFFVLPESLPPSRRAAFTWRNANPLGSLRLLRHSKALVWLAVAAFVGAVGHEVFPSVYVLYTESRYRWSGRTVGIALALVGVSSALMGALGTGPLVKRLGEKKAYLFGMLVGTLGCLGHGLAPTGGWFLVSILVAAPMDVAMPSLSALMTREVDARAQGQLQGAVSALRGISGMLGPVLFTQCFSWAIRHGGLGLRGLPFIVAAALFGVAGVIGYRAAARAEASVLEGRTHEPDAVSVSREPVL